MMIQVLGITSNPWKRRPMHEMVRNHLMLAGINQGVFLKQWGEPETQIGLDCLGISCKLGSFFLIVNPSEEAHYSVWIYKKKDRILFFTKKRLSFHFKWTEFKESSQKSSGVVECRSAEKSSFFVTATLALAA